MANLENKDSVELELKNEVTNGVAENFTSENFDKVMEEIKSSELNSISTKLDIDGGDPEPGKFLKYKETSKNGDYVIYKYKIKKGGTPEGVRAQAVAQGIATSKKGIQITNGSVDPYPENHQFRAKEVVFVRIPTEPGKFMPMGETVDHNFNKYSYRIKTGGTPEGVRAQAVKQQKAKSKEGIQITDKDGNPYAENHKFKANEVVYVRVPKKNNTPNNQPNKPSNTPNTPNTPNTQPNKPSNNSENNNIETDVKIIDGMKCKGGEYFGIDVSRFNDQTNLTSFKERNRKKWDSIEKDKRGVSFIYIRAGDGHPNAKPKDDEESIKTWTNFVKEYNSDIKVKDGKEQIATGFYWTLTNKKDAITQAKDFLKIYNNYKDVSGGEKLIPMIDLETDRFSEVKKSHKNKKGQTIIDERYNPQQFSENALKWLQYVEKQTGVVPGIYIGAKAYGDYLMGDSRFNKYLTWFSAYSSEGSNGRETGNARRINYEKGSVNVGSSQNPNYVKPAMYQSSQEGFVPGTSAKHKEKDGKMYYDTDMDHTKNIGKLFSKNNKSTETTKSSAAIQSKKKKTK